MTKSSPLGRKGSAQLTQDKNFATSDLECGLDVKGRE